VIAFELHPEAEADLDGGAAFYEDRVPGLGLDFLHEVEHAIDQICDRPLAHPLWPDVPTELGVRRKLLRRFPYGLPFMLLRDRVIILAVAHLSREPAFWLSRARGLLGVK
jgi:plasmid stabilization system protein ParE